MRVILLLVVSLINFSCSSNVSNNFKEDLKNNRWLLKSVDEKSITDLEFHKEVFIQFPTDSEDQFRGFAGCNNIFGGYELNQDSLKFINVASTRMACDKMDFEANFLKKLQTINNYKIEKDILLLFSENEEVMKFQVIFYN